jgi:hypothetical protein
MPLFYSLRAARQGRRRKSAGNAALGVARGIIPETDATRGGCSAPGVGDEPRRDLMRNRLIAAAIFGCSGLALAAAPVIAEAAPKRVLVCKNVKKKANTGTVIGAVAGGVLGNQIAGRGDRTEGTLIGAGVGAVAGHEIAKDRAKKKRCHYEYR